jgi:hypothetical protein
MAGARYHDGHEAELAKGLLQAVDQAKVPSRLLEFGFGASGRDATRSWLATAAWMRVRQPGYGNVTNLCRGGAVGERLDECRAVARVLADGNTLIARGVGLRIGYSLASTDGERDAILGELRRDRWLIDNMDNAVVDFDTADGLLRWRDARLATASEMDAFRMLEREHGVAASPPAAYRPDAASLVGRKRLHEASTP